MYEMTPEALAAHEAMIKANTARAPKLSQRQIYAIETIMEIRYAGPKPVEPEA